MQVTPRLRSPCVSGASRRALPLLALLRAWLPRVPAAAREGLCALPPGDRLRAAWLRSRSRLWTTRMRIVRLLRSAPARVEALHLRGTLEAGAGALWRLASLVVIPIVPPALLP